MVLPALLGRDLDCTHSGCPRSVDVRPFVARIEAHILEQAGIVFDAKATPGSLRVVKA